MPLAFRACKLDAVLDIRQLAAHDLHDSLLEELSGLLREVVDAGGSLGFRAPLGQESAERYWHSVGADIAEGANVTLLASVDGAPVGSVQLHPSPWPDGPHRAEVAKLMVAVGARRQGIASALMGAIEEQAKAIGRTLLILNTRVGDPSELVYAARGYTCFGSVPDYLTDGEQFFEKSYWFRHLARSFG